MPKHLAKPHPLQFFLNVILKKFFFLPQVHGESKENPFRKRSTARLLDPVVLNVVQQIPGVGKVKAMALLQHFSNIHKISNVSVEDLEPVVGQAAAQHIWAFFHEIFP